MSKGKCPNNRPKWLRCPTCFHGTCRFVRHYAGFQLWRCSSCNATRKIPHRPLH